MYPCEDNPLFRYKQTSHEPHSWQLLTPELIKRSTFCTNRCVYIQDHFLLPNLVPNLPQVTMTPTYYQDIQYKASELEILVIEQQMGIPSRMHKHFNQHRCPRHNFFRDADPTVC